MAAQSVSLDVSTSDPLAALRRAAAGAGGSWARRIGMLAALAAAVVAVALVAPRVGRTFGDAFVRALHADPRWVVAGVLFELASFAGYVTLFWHVAGRGSSRIGLRASWEVALASTAATRLLPTAGAGGAALTFWSLRKAGHSTRGATSTLLTFLVVLYSVFLGALAIAGALLATGAASGGHVSLELSAAPAVGAGGAILLALALALRAGRRSEAPAGRLHSAGHALGASVREAASVVRHPHLRLLGAPAWWGFDMLVLWATFHAFGAPPSPAVLVLAYFLGQVANTVPLPGAASGGMVGAFLAVGMPAEVALPAVLSYRAIAIWTPVPAGAVALAGLRRTVARWAAEDSGSAEPEAALVSEAIKESAPAPVQAAPVSVIARPTRRPRCRAGPPCTFPPIAVVTARSSPVVRAPPLAAAQ